MAEQEAELLIITPFLLPTLFPHALTLNEDFSCHSHLPVHFYNFITHYIFYFVIYILHLFGFFNKKRRHSCLLKIFNLDLSHTLNPFLNLLAKLNHSPLFLRPDFGHAVNSNYEDDYRSIVLGFFNQTNTFSNY